MLSLAADHQAHFRGPLVVRATQVENHCSKELS